MSTDESPVGHLPPTPTCVADLDLLVHATGHHRHTAHLPDHHSDEPMPFCGRDNCYHDANWEQKPPTVFSADPDAWLSLCEHCLAALDREGNNE